MSRTGAIEGACVSAGSIGIALGIVSLRPGLIAGSLIVWELPLLFRHLSRNPIKNHRP